MGEDGTAHGEVTLAALVWSVRQQLHEAEYYGKGDQFRFDVDTIALEVVVEASTSDTKTGGGNLSLHLKVLGVGAEIGGKGDVGREHGNTSTAKITLTITPRDEHNPAGKMTIAGTDTQPPPTDPNT